MPHNRTAAPRAAVAFALLVSFAGAAAVSRADDVLPSAQSIFRTAKAAFRARRHPAFVVYTLERYEHLNELGIVEHKYDLRVWYRACDGAALVRAATGGKDLGPLRFEHPHIDVDADPGPPAFDAFGAATAGSYRASAVESQLRTIAHVTISSELDYDAQLDGTENGWTRLRLLPVRDPANHRLREISVDVHDGYALRRAITDGGADIRFDSVGGVLVASVIFGLTSVDPRFGIIDVKRWSEYRFLDVSFPATLPDWYFDPSSYGAHAHEAPT